jgi:hypothetical protein
MSNITFKQFNTFMSIEGEPTDEQINEIFGVFKNNKKIDDLKKKRAELTAAQKADKARKDAIMKTAAAKARGQQPEDEDEDAPKGSSSARAQQARERGAEYGDWRVAEEVEGSDIEHFSTSQLHAQVKKLLNQQVSPSRDEKLDALLDELSNRGEQVSKYEAQM